MKECYTNKMKYIYIYYCRYNYIIQVIKNSLSWKNPTGNYSTNFSRDHNYMHSIYQLLYQGIVNKQDIYFLVNIHMAPCSCMFFYRKASFFVFHERAYTQNRRRITSGPLTHRLLKLMASGSRQNDAMCEVKPNLGFLTSMFDIITRVFICEYQF